MRARVWRSAAVTFAGVGAAVLTDAYVFPAPRSSRPEEHLATQDSVSIFPPLAPSSLFPEQVVLSEGGRRTTLSLTGQYARSRQVLFATIYFYEIASYAEVPPNGSVDEMLESLWRNEGRKVYLLRFLFSVPGWQLRQAVHDEMGRSFGDVPVEEHRGQVDALLNAFASGASAGDVFYLARVAGDRVYLGVRRSKNLDLVTESGPLARAIWRMWAGPTAEPGRAGLVKRLVGRDKRS